MRVAVDAVVLLAHHQAQLAVRLQVDEAVDDVDAGRLEPVGPGDVVALVEARLQLDEHGHLLALLGGVDQEIDQRRVLADPVERHLDRDDQRIGDRGAQERLDGDERIERVVHQVVLVADLVEDRLEVVGVPQLPRRERRILQLRAVQLLDRAPVAEAHAIRGADHDVLFDGEVLDQDVEDAARHRRVDLEQRQRAVAQLLQPLVDGLEQVVGLVLLDHHVGVADDAEEVRAAHLRAGEQLVDVVLDDVFEEGERQAALRARCSPAPARSAAACPAP